MPKDDAPRKQETERRAKPDVSRRNFITKAAIGAGATAAIDARNNEGRRRIRSA